MFGQMLQLLGRATYRGAEGIGRFVERTPAMMARAFGAARGAGRAGGARLGAAFKGLGSRASSGVYNSAEAIGRTFSDPRGTAQSLATGAGNAARGFNRWRTTSPWAPAGIGRRLNAAGFVSGPRQYASNLWNASRPTLGATAGAMGRGARAMGRGAMGLGAAALGGAAAISTAPFKAVAGIFGKMAGAGGVGKVLGLFRKLAGPAGLLGIHYALKKFTEQVIESNRGLAKWNGQLSSSFAKLDIVKMRMDIQTANASSGTASELNDSYGEMLREFQPFRQDMAIFMNLVATNLVKSSTATLAMLRAMAADNAVFKEILDGLNVLEDEAKKKNKNGDFPGNATMRDLINMGGGAAPAPLDRIDPQPFPNDGPPAGNPRRRADGAIMVGGRRIPFHFEGGGP